MHKQITKGLLALFVLVTIDPACLAQASPGPATGPSTLSASNSQTTSSKSNRLFHRGPIRTLLNKRPHIARKVIHKMMHP